MCRKKSRQPANSKKKIDDYDTVTLCATCQNKVCYWYDVLALITRYDCPDWIYDPEVDELLDPD